MINVYACAARLGIFGKKQMTLEDFFDICDREMITVDFHSAKTSLYLYVPQMNAHYIILSKRLNQRQLLLTSFHELGHYAMHGGSFTEMRFWCNTTLQNKREIEADQFAKLAVFGKFHRGKKAKAKK